MPDIRFQFIKQALKTGIWPLIEEHTGGTEEQELKKLLINDSFFTVLDEKKLMILIFVFIFCFLSKFQEAKYTV